MGGSMTMSTPKRKHFPLRIQRFGKDGWWYVACDEIPGLSSFGPDLAGTLKGIEKAGTELLRRQGRENAVVTVERRTAPTEDNPPMPAWQSVDEYELHEMAA